VSQDLDAQRAGRSIALHIARDETGLFMSSGAGLQTGPTMWIFSDWLSAELGGNLNLRMKKDATTLLFTY
jgi:hypothetical protein